MTPSATTPRITEHTAIPITAPVSGRSLPFATPSTSLSYRVRWPA